MENKPYVSRALLGAASGLALAIASTSLAVAQQKGAQQQPQQKQQTQQQSQGQSGQPSQMLQQSISSLEQLRPQIEQAQSSQLKQVAQRAMEPMQRMENALKQAGDQAQTQPAMDSLKTARAALQEQRPDKQLIVRAIDDVIEDAKRVHQNMAQAQPQGSQSASDRQGSAGGSDRTASAGQDRSADIQVQQKAPNITVTQQPPDVVVKQPAPQVTVEQPRPDVTVKSAEPNVSVKQAGRPEVTVQKKGEPDVSVQGSDQQRQAQATRPGDQDAARDTKDGTAQRDTTMTPPGATDRTTTTQAETQTDNRVVSMGREIVGKEIYGANNENIGEVEDVVIASGSTQIEAVLVDVGGFLGIGARRVAIPINSLQMQGDDRITTTMTEAQVRDLPEHRDQATR